MSAVTGPGPWNRNPAWAQPLIVALAGVAVPAALVTPIVTR